MCIDLKKMKRYLFISPASDFDTTTESDFIYDYLTTLTPFEIGIDNEVPDINGIDGLQMIIYGIGGLLIFLVIWTFCYYCFMPPISDDRSNTIIRRNAESLRARARARAIANRNGHEGIEEVSSLSTAPNEVSESRQTAHRNSESRRPVERQGTREVNGAPQNEGRFFPQRLQNLFRPNTIAKQVRESRQTTNQNPESRHTTMREQLDSQTCTTSQQNEEKELPTECLSDTLFLKTVPKDLCLSTTDQKPSKEDITEVLSSIKPIEHPSPVERRSESSPNLRRRFSSIEDTPRLSSSWH